MTLYWLLKVLVGPLAMLVFRPWTRGRTRVPPHGPVILAANHLSLVDWLLIPLVTPRRVTFLAKSEFFELPGFGGAFVRWLMRTSGQIPVHRAGGLAADRALDRAVDILGHGSVVGIFPEGTRSPDGRLYRGRTGVARLALETGATVIPVAVIGTDRVLPIGARVPRIHRVGVVFGRPRHYGEIRGTTDEGVLRAITDEIMHDLTALTGQPYCDSYAADFRLP
ncbi:lysophospholipid acyltransferase family protein [Leifsonia shinshuensis]|uniref:1-acyl-sn-glycerol-3-phosphate acyltransferase n=1 Tax=Leifsonia shinshuensis TaxID=150026 RepID=A0A853CVF2_9MICO|nr:lysophospholipid acyltransferase family protein [Leifsonia shinshuensis]NYJ24398.1 1-acyl-sn-glycerol-3-phosphate acyltransferase [Leifsonia shinshuensis]